MATRDIRTFHETIVCDMCGRTLLRGEHAETYLAGGSRREVCDLCADRALHEGWIREDTRLDRPEPVRPERGRSFLGRLRQRSDRTAERRAARAEQDAWEPPEAFAEPAEHDEPSSAEPEEPEPAPAAEPPPRRPRRRPVREAAEPPSAPRSRHVRAVPTAPEQRTAAAMEAFNQTEHTRTVAGVARSLGEPTVAARAAGPGSRVTIVVSWELCWYRYEVELSEDGSGVHQAAQGYELSELADEDRLPTATADEYGQLHPAGA